MTRHGIKNVKQYTPLTFSVDGITLCFPTLSILQQGGFLTHKGERTMENGKPKVVVYAIVKNESKFVERWVRSMSEADEIVVMDTGSTDDTVAKFQTYS